MKHQLLHFKDTNYNLKSFLFLWLSRFEIYSQEAPTSTTWSHNIYHKTKSILVFGHKTKSIWYKGQSNCRI